MCISFHSSLEEPLKTVMEHFIFFKHKQSRFKRHQSGEFKNMWIYELWIIGRHTVSPPHPPQKFLEVKTIISSCLLLLVTDLALLNQTQNKT